MIKESANMKFVEVMTGAITKSCGKLGIDQDEFLKVFNEEILKTFFNHDI